MTRFSEKALLNSGIIDELKKGKELYRRGKCYRFECWTYERGRLSFGFADMNGGDNLFIQTYLYLYPGNDFSDLHKVFSRVFDNFEEAKK